MSGNDDLAESQEGGSGSVFVVGGGGGGKVNVDGKVSLYFFASFSCLTTPTCSSKREDWLISTGDINNKLDDDITWQ